MFSKFRLKRNEKGATLIEYVLIASLLSVALVGGYKSIGTGYSRIYENINKELP